MNHLMKVIKFEYLGALGNKSFKVTSILFLAVIIIGMFVPQISSLFSNSKKPEPGLQSTETSSKDLSDNNKAIIVVSNKVFTTEFVQKYFSEYEWTITESTDIEDVKSKIANDELALCIKVEGIHAEVFSKASSFNVYNLVDNTNEMISSAYRITKLEEAGVSTEVINSITDIPAKTELVTIGKDFAQSFAVGYIILFMLYLCIILYGQQVLMSVVIEKTSKAMELLVSSVKPVYLIFGKVIGIGLAGLSQFSSFLIAIILGVTVNREAWMKFFPMLPNTVDVVLSSNLLIYAFIFFILGFFTFAFLFSAFGSTVSKIEDANSIIVIPMLLFVASFIIAMNGLSNPTADFIKITSFIPFLSPLVMFMRICSSSVPFLEIIISIGISSLTLVFSGYVSAKIYRIGVLLYGNTPKLKDIIKYAMQK